MTGSGQCGGNITWNLNAAGKLTITGTGAFYDDEDGENYLPWRRFSRYIVDVEIGDGITNVPDMAFRSCDYLESVTLGADVKSVGSEAFAECVRLTDISGADSLESIGYAAFARCTILTDFDFAGIKTIGGSAFYECGLTEVVIPDSVHEIGENAFNNCQNLESAVIGQRVLYLDSGVFSNCPTLKKIVIPESVTVIDEYAFSGCEISDVYYAGTAAQWSRVRGGGADSLEYCAYRIYFRSTGPESATPPTYEIDVNGNHTDHIQFTVNASEDGIRRLFAIKCYYDESGRMIDTDWYEEVLPSNDNDFNAYKWRENGVPKTVKLILLDEQFHPLCPSATGTFG